MDTNGTTVEELRTMEAIQHMAHIKLELRDQFAMACMTGILSGSSFFGSPERLAEIAYEYADAMLAVRNR